LNPHPVARTSPSSWRVCLFRHSDENVDRSAGARKLDIVVKPGPARRVRFSRGLDQRQLLGNAEHEELSGLTPVLAGQGCVSGLVGGTRMLHDCTDHISEGPFGSGETPLVNPDQARRLGCVKSGNATMSCHSIVSTWV
jgi:hypothetical protein